MINTSSVDNELIGSAVVSYTGLKHRCCCYGYLQFNERGLKLTQDADRPIRKQDFTFV